MDKACKTTSQSNICSTDAGAHALEQPQTYDLCFQSIPAPLQGNSLGLFTSNNLANTNSSSKETASIIACLLTGYWTSAADSPAVENSIQKLLVQVEGAAEDEESKVGKASVTGSNTGVPEDKVKAQIRTFVYLNYASPFQNPVASYGNGSVESLKAASTKYYPSGVFQDQVPGGFKLSSQ